MARLPMWRNSRVFLELSGRRSSLSFVVAGVSEYWARAAGSPLDITSVEPNREGSQLQGKQSCILDTVFETMPCHVFLSPQIKEFLKPTYLCTFQLQELCFVLFYSIHIGRQFPRALLCFCMSFEQRQTAFVPDYLSKNICTANIFGRWRY